MKDMARRTKKQRIVMGIILKALSEGREVSVGEIYRELPYVCSYGALRITLRFLRKHDLVYYDTVHSRNLYKPTMKGMSWFTTGS